MNTFTVKMIVPDGQLSQFLRKVQTEGIEVVNISADAVESQLRITQPLTFTTPSVTVSTEPESERDAVLPEPDAVLPESDDHAEPSSRHHKHWTTHEISLVREFMELYPSDYAFKQNLDVISAAIGRTAAGIKKQRSVLLKQQYGS